MIETAHDPKLYSRALERTAEKTASVNTEETFARFMRRTGLDAIEAFEDEIDKLRSEKGDPYVVLRKCREKFAFYAGQHRAKNTEESTAKAVVNEEMVAMIDAVLG